MANELSPLRHPIHQPYESRHWMPQRQRAPQHSVLDSNQHRGTTVFYLVRVFVVCPVDVVQCCTHICDCCLQAVDIAGQHSYSILPVPLFRLLLDAFPIVQCNSRKSFSTAAVVGVGAPLAIYPSWAYARTTPNTLIRVWR